MLKRKLHILAGQVIAFCSHQNRCVTIASSENLSLSSVPIPEAEGYCDDLAFFGNSSQNFLAMQSNLRLFGGEIQADGVKLLALPYPFGDFVPSSMIYHDDAFCFAGMTSSTDWRGRKMMRLTPNGMVPLSKLHDQLVEDLIWPVLHKPAEGHLFAISSHPRDWRLLSPSGLSKLYTLPRGKKVIGRSSTDLFVLRQIDANDGECFPLLSPTANFGTRHFPFRDFEEFVVFEGHLVGRDSSDRLFALRLDSERPDWFPLDSA
jgi:hypothetical protein